MPREDSAWGQCGFYLALMYTEVSAHGKGHVDDTASWHDIM